MFIPSIVPASEAAAYIVKDDFGSKPRGEYNDRVRVVTFNTSEGWAHDLSAEFASEIQRRVDLDCEELIGTVANFVEFYARRERQLSLRLA